MKKSIIILAVAALLFSCKDYSYESWQPDTSLRRSGEVTLLATFENLDTKVTMDENGHGLWAPGDAIAVACSDGSFVEFFLDGTGDTRRATFKGTVPDGLEIGTVAVYPADAAISVADNQLTLSVPSRIDIDSSEYEGVLVGAIGSNWQVDFKQALAYLNLQLTNFPTEAERIRFMSGSKTLSGLFTAGIGDILGRGLRPSDGAGGQGLEVSVSRSAKTLSAMLPVPADEYAVITADFIDNKGTVVLSQTLSDYAVTLERAELRRMSIALSDVAAPPCRINIGGERIVMEETEEGSKRYEGTFEVPATGSFTIELDGAPYGAATYSGAGGLGTISAATSGLPVDKIKNAGKSKQTYYVKRAQGTMVSTEVASNPFTLDLDSPGFMHVTVDCSHPSPRYALRLVETPDPSVIFHEDFDLCVFGGDYIAPADGRGGDIGTYDGWLPCTATRTQNQVPFNFDYPDKVSTALPLQEFIDSYGLSQWDFACAAERPGGIQLCTGSVPGFMVTPAFSAIEGTADAVIDIDIARFSTTSVDPIYFTLLSGGTFGKATIVRDAYTSAKARQSFEEATVSYTEFSDEGATFAAPDNEYFPHSWDNADIDKPLSHIRLEVKGITGATRLKIDARKGASYAPRIFVFDIKVTRK